MTKPPIALEERDETGGRLFSPSAGRNKADVAAGLAALLPKKATVLEVGSGTGEHGIEALSARPDLTWQFTDPDEVSRNSQAAWLAHLGLSMNAPLNLDMSDIQSRAQITQSYDAIFSANMIHIAPISALHGLAELAAKSIKAEGQMILYGPFLLGDDSAASNLEFDASLKRRNIAWGVRELDSVKHIFAKKGFNAAILRGMPKNNFLLGMSRG